MGSTRLTAALTGGVEHRGHQCALRIEADQRAIVVAGLPVHHYCADDAVAEPHAMVFLVEQGFAQQTEVARAFARSVRRRRSGRRIQSQ